VRACVRACVRQTLNRACCAPHAHAQPSPRVPSASMHGKHTGTRGRARTLEVDVRVVEQHHAQRPAVVLVHHARAGVDEVLDSQAGARRHAAVRAGGQLDGQVGGHHGAPAGGHHAVARAAVVVVVVVGWVMLPQCLSLSLDGNGRGNGGSKGGRQLRAAALAHTHPHLARS